MDENKFPNNEIKSNFLKRQPEVQSTPKGKISSS